jgi:LPXTG-motif cell wall-anchored protein
MLILSVAAALDVTRPSVKAQTNAGAAVVVSAQLPTTGQPITSGGSATVFSLQLPSGAACSGDSASSDYRVQSYMVPSSVDPASLTYGSQGPLPLGTGANYRQPLFTTTTQRYVNQTTGVASSPGGGGQVPTLPGFNFAAAPFAGGPSFLPPGPYNVGIACTSALGTVLDKYWNVVMTFATSAADSPSGLTWSVESASGTTTTVAGTSTTVAGATTTTVAGATTTTVAGATTTTVAGATTTTVAGAAQSVTLSPASPTPGGSYRVTHPNCRVGDTITVTQAQSTPPTQTATCAVPVSGIVRPQQTPTVGTATVTFTAAPTAAGTYTVTSSGPNSGTRTATFTITAVTSNTIASTSGSPSGTSTGTIPATGSSTTSMIVWGVLLLVLGRVAILLGRKPKVIQADR